MTQVVLHIGTPKTGTTAIQHALATQDRVLVEQGIAFLQAGRPRAAHNALANAIMRRGAAHKFRAELDEEMAACLASDSVKTVLLSSEIFALIDPLIVREALPDMADCPTRIVLYLRRQDQYAEAFYKQRLKNGRLSVPFEDFLESETCGQITDYTALIDNWAKAYPKAKIVPRLYDRKSFPNGDIVADFSVTLGLAPDTLGTVVAEQNVSPSRAVVDIMLALAPHFSGSERRAMFRAVKAQGLEGFSGKGDLFSAAARASYAARFTAQNEALRAQWFPKSDELFKSPLGQPIKDLPTSDASRALLAAFLAEAFARYPTPA